MDKCSCSAQISEICGKLELKVQYRAVAPAQVFAHIHHESERQVDNNRGSHRKKGGVNEEQTNAGGRNT